MNKWIAVVVLDLMVLTAAVGLKAISTPAAQSSKVQVGKDHCWSGSLVVRD